MSEHDPELTQGKASADEDSRRSRAKASRIGFDFLASILVCIGLGILADRQLGSSPWGVMVGTLAGFIAGFTSIWRALNGYGQKIGYRRD